MKKIVLALFMILLFTNHGFSQICNNSISSAHLNINNINATIDNAGSLFPLEAPKDSDITTIFSGALWIGGLDAGKQLHMAAATYRQNGNDFFPGPLDSTGAVINTLYSFDTVWVMYKSTIDSFTSGFFTTIPNSIKYWPAEGNPNLPDLPNQSLAPFVDVSGNGIYDPSKGDYPAIRGNEATWEVFNDNFCPVHGETGGFPLGVEVHLMAYAFKAQGCLNNTTFYQYDIFNKSSSVYDSTYVGIWADPDLGWYLDDYAGSIPALNMGVCYNGEAVDGVGKPNYGNHPPLVGIQMVNLPKDENGDTIHMDDFLTYVNDFNDIGNPVGAGTYYNYLKALWKDSTHVTYWGDGYGGKTKCNYMYPSDPTDTSAHAWSECHDSVGLDSAVGNPPNDVRFIMGFGPTQFNPGATISYTSAVLFFDTTGIIYPCPSFSYLTDMAQCIKESNVTGINTPSTPQNTFINFYPNPMGNAGTFSFKTNSVKEIKLFNILGEQVRDYTTIDGTTQPLQRGDLTSGIYFYSVLTNNGEVGNGKIVLQ